MSSLDTSSLDTLRKIRRKPVPVSNAFSPAGLSSHTLSIQTRIDSDKAINGHLAQSPSNITTPSDSSYDSSIFDLYAEDEAVEDMAQLKMTDPPTTPLPTEAYDTRPGPASLQPLDEHDPNATPRPAKSSKNIPLAAGKAFQSAYGEVRHFAGGLVSHPSESTKHYTILRHSHGLVYYSGSYTNLAITVFGDREVPPDRSFWLQRKGWSGKTGMRAGALFGTHGAWIDVTPSITATPDQIKPADERAWQRDIKKFFRKAPKKLAGHQVRETSVLRIPCAADDGYLRVVMCAGEKGKKSLCPSPVFRLASTSMSSSSVRGASLSTLPVEAAIKIGTFAARRTANTLAGPYVETARTFVTGQITSVYQPSAMLQTAATTAYDKSGITEQFDSMNNQYEASKEGSNQVFQHGPDELLSQPIVTGDNLGPQAPYPIKFHGKVVAGTGKSMANLGIPTANVVNVDSKILLKHSGIHFGWAAIEVPKKLRNEILIDDDWREAIISVIPDPEMRLDVVQKRAIRVYIIEDFEGARFFDAKISVMMMAYIRPVPISMVNQQSSLEVDVANLYRDIASAIASLARPSWQADETLERVKSAASSRSFTERYVDMRQTTQKQIDRVPTWRLGVRSDGAAVNDKFIGSGGFTISR